MNKNSFAVGIAIFALVVAGVAILVASNAANNLGGNTEWDKKSFVSGLWGGSSRQVELQRDGDIVSTRDGTFRDLTLSGGDLTVTTTNTATSSLTIGCIQTYATSTATSIVLQPSTANEATTTFSGTGFGLLAWQYGSCPK